ncbi:MAG TPA: YhcH/YjgK/YiaL family protein, partial [Rectinemataceae bacterium]|nr:YhcH/YjgK/YiaL family protein [Rectinemataceae bacterium]
VYEAHRDYIDIQILLSGEELCYWTPLQGLTPRNAFDEGNDIGFYDGQGGVSFPLTPDTFAIFFPHDAHKPSCNLARKCEVRKVVIKIAI